MADRQAIEKIEQLTQEIEQLKKEKRQKLFQFEALDELVQKTQNELKDTKAKYQSIQSQVSYNNSDWTKLNFTS